MQVTHGTSKIKKKGNQGFQLVFLSSKEAKNRKEKPRKKNPIVWCHIISKGHFNTQGKKDIISKENASVILV